MIRSRAIQSSQTSNRQIILGSVQLTLSLRPLSSLSVSCTYSFVSLQTFADAVFSHSRWNGSNFRSTSSHGLSNFNFRTRFSSFWSSTKHANVDRCKNYSRCWRRGHPCLCRDFGCRPSSYRRTRIILWNLGIGLGDREYVA